MRIRGHAVRCTGNVTYNSASSYKNHYNMIEKKQK